jgi:RNA polymerase sigma-70 factor (ECF subfamily)
MTATVEEIWQKLAGGLRGYIRGRVDDHATAEDILQDVFLRIHQKLPTLRASERLEAWVWRITRNAITDYYRRHIDTLPVPETLPAEANDHAGEPQGLRAALNRMIQSLPRLYRDAIVLAELDGLTQKELANRLNISLSGAKSRVQRGRVRLKQMLDNCCIFEFDRRGKVIDCEPRTKAGCDECG